MKYLVTKLVGYTTVYEVEAGSTKGALENREDWKIFQEESLYDEDCFVSHRMGVEGEYVPVISFHEDRLNLNDLCDN